MPTASEGLDELHGCDEPLSSELCLTAIRDECAAICVDYIEE